MRFLPWTQGRFFLGALAVLSLARTALAGPALTWEKETVELSPGLAAYRAGVGTLEGHFAFTNTGTEPVEIVALEPDCGCTTAEMMQRTVAPGARGEVVAKFTVADRVGQQEKHIVVRSKSDAADAPLARLTLIVHLPDLLRIEPEPTVRWKLGEPGKPRTITLTAAFAEMPIERITVATSQDGFTPQLRVTEAGRRYELTVTPASTDLLLSGSLPLSCTFCEPGDASPTPAAADHPSPVRVYNVLAVVEPRADR